MKKPLRVFLILLSLMLFSGCSDPGEPSPAGLSQIQVSFDGETCLVTGHKPGPLHGAILNFENLSDSDANLITLLLKENMPPDDIFRSFQPGSTELPEGTFKHATSTMVQSGERFENFTTKFYEGNYAVLCVSTSTQEYYFGDWFSNK